VRRLRPYRGEHEIDLIAERADGRVVAIDVKLARTIRDDDVRHLNWLARRIGDDLLDRMIVTPTTSRTGSTAASATGRSST